MTGSTGAYSSADQGPTSSGRVDVPGRSPQTPGSTGHPPRAPRSESRPSCQPLTTEPRVSLNNRLPSANRGQVRALRHRRRRPELFEPERGDGWHWLSTSDPARRLSPSAVNLIGRLAPWIELIPFPPRSLFLSRRGEAVPPDDPTTAHYGNPYIVGLSHDPDPVGRADPWGGAARGMEIYSLLVDRRVECAYFDLDQVGDVLSGPPFRR